MKSSLWIKCSICNKLQRGEIKFLHRLYDTIVGGGYDEEEKDENGNIKLNSAYGNNIKVNIGRKSWIIDIDTKNIDDVLNIKYEVNKCNSSNYIQEVQFGNKCYRYYTYFKWLII